MSRYFSEEETESAVLGVGYEVVSQVSHGARRWSEYIQTVVRADDGTLYRVGWESGLTENQEDMFYGGECPEVHKYSNLEVKDNVQYLTDEEAEEQQKSSVAEDIESLRLVVNAEDVDECFSVDKVDEISSALNLLGELKVLDQVDNFEKYRQASEQYLNALLDYANRSNR